MSDAIGPVDPYATSAQPARWTQDPRFDLSALTAGQRYTAVIVLALVASLVAFGFRTGTLGGGDLLTAAADEPSTSVREARTSLSPAAAPALAVAADESTPLSSTPLASPEPLSSPDVTPPPSEPLSSPEPPAAPSEPTPPSGGESPGSPQPAPSPAPSPLPALPAPVPPVTTP